MTEFAAALNKQNRGDMGDMATAMVGAERIIALEKRVAKLEAALTNPKGHHALPTAPAADTDPAA